MQNTLGIKFNFQSLLRFAFPSMTMMVFLSLYTIVDGMFVSRYAGTTALSAVNMIFPAYTVGMAVALMIAAGGCAIVAKKLGEGKTMEARQDLSFFVLVEAVLGIVCAVCGYLFIDPIVTFLGASPAQYELCRTYGVLMMAFAPTFYLQTAFQSFFVAAGRPGFGLGVTVAAGLTNVALDYLFIVVMKMGIAGAALGTGLGTCIPAAAGLIFFTFSKTNPLRFTRPHYDFRMLASACGNGASEMVTNLANSITTFLYNLAFLNSFGEDGVAAITIVLYFQFVFSAIFFGFSSGVAPIFSYKYGAGDKGQLKVIFRLSMLLILIFSVLSWAVSDLSIAEVLKLFTPAGTSVHDITIAGFPVYAAGFLLMGVSIFASAMFTAFSNGVVSAVISFVRTFIFLAGSIILLPQFFGSDGLWMAAPAAELAGLLVSVFFLFRMRRKYGY